METAATARKRVDIRRNDTVKVMTGRDKGNEAALRVFPNDAKVLVEHVMLVKKHVRPDPQRNVKGGIAEQESRISISNVALCAPAASAPYASGTSSRESAKCGSAEHVERRWISSFW